MNPDQLVAVLHATIAAVCPIDGIAGPFNAGAALPWLTYPDNNGALWRIDFAVAATDQQKAAAESALRSFTPAPPAIVITYLQFRALFTAGENQAIMTAAQSNHAVLDWLLQAVGAREVDLADPQLKAGLDALVALGLITAARETAILANQPSPAA